MARLRLRASARLLFATALISALHTFGFPTEAVGQSDPIRLTLSEARRRAIGNNASLAVARLDTAIARGQLRESGTIRFNPSFDIVSARQGNEMEAGLSQEVELFRQRSARIRASRAGFAVASLGITNSARLLIGSVDRAFFRLAANEQRIILAREVLALNERLEDVARRQLGEGAVSRLEYNLAVVELGRSRSRFLTARREYDQSSVELRTLLQLPTDSVTAVVEGTHKATGIGQRDYTAPHDSAIDLRIDSLTRVANARRPDLQQVDRLIAQSDALINVARREALPNLLLRGVSEVSGNSGRRMIRPGLGVSLPFFNRNQGVVQAERARALQARLSRTALLTDIRAEISAEVSAYLTAASEVEVFESSVLAPARQNRELVESAYREGKVGLPIVLLIRNQAIDAELDYWSAWLTEREAFANLEEATGQNIIDLTVATTPRR